MRTSKRNKHEQKVVRSTHQLDIGNGRHIVHFTRTREATILNDEPGRTFANLPTMTIEESVEIVREMNLPEDLREEILGRLEDMKRERDATRKGTPEDSAK